MKALTEDDQEPGSDPLNDDDADYEAGECHGDEDRGHKEALYGDC